MKMSQKLLTILSLLIIAYSYTEKKGALILGDDDFPSIFETHENLFVSFCLPSTEEEKGLEMMYEQIISSIKTLNLNVKFAKVDVSKNNRVTKEYDAGGLPTFILFRKGEAIKCEVQHTLGLILGFIEKIVVSPVVKVDYQRYRKIRSSWQTVVVYHGNFPSSKYVQKLNQLSLEDKQSNYYWGQKLGEKDGTLQIIRGSATIATYRGPIDDDVKQWVQKYRLGLTTEFGRQTLLYSLKKKQKALAFLDPKDTKQYQKGFKILEQVARKYKKADILFGVIKEQDMQYDLLVNTFKFKPQHTFMLFNYTDQTKHMFEGTPTVDKLYQFITNPDTKLYGINDQIEEKVKEQSQNQQL